MLAAARPAGAAGEKRTGFYVLETFYLQQGAQVARMHEYFSKVALPVLQRVRHTGPVIYLESLVAPHMPQMIAIYGFQSLDEMWGVHTRIMQDPELVKNFEQWDSGDAPFDQQSSVLLEAADYSPRNRYARRTAENAAYFRAARVPFAHLAAAQGAARAFCRTRDSDLSPRGRPSSSLQLDTHWPEHAEPHVPDTVRESRGPRKGVGCFRRGSRLGKGSQGVDREARADLERDSNLAVQSHGLFTGSLAGVQYGQAVSSARRMVGRRRRK